MGRSRSRSSAARSSRCRDAQGHVGHFTVNYVSLDDSNPTTGEWDPGVTASNAKAAAQDPTTIAYLGDFNSGRPPCRCR